MKIYKKVSGLLPVNSYFIVNEDLNEGFVIDGGTSAKGVLDFAKEKGFTLTAMLLTHTHFDHASCTKDLQNAGVKVYVSEQESDGLSNKTINLSDRFFISFESTVADKTFANGEEFSLCGIAVKALITPGHSKGSACFLIGDNLFTGDTLMCETIGRTDLPTGDMDTLIKTLNRIKNFDKDYKIFAGHGEDTTLSHEKIYNPFLV